MKYGNYNTEVFRLCLSLNNANWRLVTRLLGLPLYSRVLLLNYRNGHEMLDLTKYEFHDGNIIDIEHMGSKIRIAMESAEISAHEERATIKGILKMSDVRSLEINGKKSKYGLKMGGDSGRILAFLTKDSKVHLFVKWANYPKSKPDEEYTDITIEAAAVSWEDDPLLFNPYGLSLIEERHVSSLILLAAPSIKKQLEAQPLISYFAALVMLADHVTDSFKQGNAEEFPRIFNLIERLQKDGEESVQEAATTGFLECIQNRCSHPETDILPDVFEKYLLAESKQSWDALNNFWNGT